MAQIPYRPFTTEQPFAPGEQIREVTPGEAFGENIGRAIEHLGTTTAQVGGELFNRAYALQDLKNETDARAKAIDATQDMAMENEKFKAMGERAGDPGVLREHLNNLEQIRQAHRGQLSNPYAQRYYDAEAASLQNRFTVIGSEIAGSAFKGRVIGTAEAQMDLDTKGWSDPLDEGEVQKKIDKIHELSGTVGASYGWEPGGSQEQDYVFKRVSKLRYGQITQLAQTNSQAALDLLDRDDVKKQMTNDEYNHALDIANSHHIPVAAEYIKKNFYDPSKTLKENEDTAAAQVDKHADSPDQRRRLESAVRANVKSEYYYQKQAQNQEYSEAEQHIYDAISSGKYRTTQQLMADPAVAAAVNSARPGFRESLENKLAAYWHPRDQQTHEDNYRRLLGKSIADPQGFLADDLWDAKNQVSDGQLGRLLAARKAILKGAGPAADPHVLQASEYIRRAFPNSVPRAQRDDPQYQQWLGSLQGAIENVEASKQAKLGPEDWQKIGKALIQEVPHTGWIHNYKVFEEPVPDKVLEHFHQQGMTDDDEITYNYHRARAIQTMNDLFSGASVAPKE